MGLIRQHGGSVALIALVSVLGIAATAGFQLVVIRGLEPERFGLLAAFLAILNVVAVGSSAVRNSVAVETAIHGGRSSTARFFRDPSLLEALVLGGGTAIILLLAAPLLGAMLFADPQAVWFTAAAALPYFLFARAQGLLQGVGRTTSVVWWTTGSQLAQFALAVLAVAAGAGVVGVLVIVLGVAVLGASGASLQSRAIRTGSERVFSPGTIVVLLLTIGFAWLTNADIVLVRAFGASETAGAYAAAGVIVKTVLIVPTTLSLYLLPRFVGRRADAAMTRLGVNISLGITAVSGALMIVACWLFGQWIISILYPESYGEAAMLLPMLAGMWLPWAAAQAVLIRITAAASRAGLFVIGAAAVGQWLLGWWVLPDVTAFMLVNGVIGVLVLAALFGIHMGASRMSAPDAPAARRTDEG